jgi:CBS domain-containing protein
MQRPIAHLPIYARETIGADRSVNRDTLVFCPREQRTIDASRCNACPNARSVSASAVDCTPPDRCLRSEPDASTLPVGAVASLPFTCVDGDLSLRSIGPKLPREPWALPVVDAHGRFGGFVSRTSPHDRGLPPRLSRMLRIGDLAVGHALAVGENCTLREAVECLGLRHARCLAIVDSDGAVRGLLTDIQALRAWIALHRRG